MPGKERRKFIQEKANNILSSPGNKKVRFDITKYLVEKERFQIGLQYMEDDTTGILLVDDTEYIPNTNTHRLILINALLRGQADFLRRKRFIIAHEYGHYILHKNDKVQFAHRDTSKKDTASEKEADYFARCLLMPESSVRQIAEMDIFKELEKSKKVAIIAEFFYVTKKKAAQRLNELGIVA